MKPSRSVALLVETSNSYSRGLLQGIASYMHQNELWQISLPEQERNAGPPPWLKTWKGDGVIARIENESMVKVLKTKNIPIVDVSAARLMPEVPWIEIDEMGIGQAAFEHLSERGFEHFAFCGEPMYRWSQLRQEGFVHFVEQAGFTVDVYPNTGTKTVPRTIAQEKKQLGRWLKTLPPGTALLACYDFKAQQILEACRDVGIKVPEQLALLGVDNDEVLCDLCTPPLSSVIPAAKRIGFEAAQALDTLMNGGTVDPLGIFIEPLGVVTRQSTDIVAVQDADIADALRFIRDHHCEGINVEDVLKVVPLSRRTLESRFRQTVGRTIYQEIIRRRINRICDLLNTTDLSLAQIALRTGFQSEEYMSVAFRRAKGIPPGKYRKQR
ncbi:AraC family transcriptional regulator [Neorhodopirellula pilleata]|uniref:Xylose operon regulatory protein n=1 Tax=Neorhodopirellula pilleata TaxID=2714738 RepID=A0A5C6AW92_9BACT|nr:DNA-binding transcriptional regulator [Neorhodopirellula pilleata]TWU03898.1 Xylose operon regulatory protein [Neorhodopirellula pilleata]